MLDPEMIADTIVAKLRAIPDVIAAMNGEPERIAAFHDIYGMSLPLRTFIAKMPAPGIVIAFDATLPGNFDGQTIFKHRFCCYIRVGNQAGAAVPIAYGTLWKQIICSGPVAGWDDVRGPNLRSVQILAGLDIMDTPGVARQVDEDGIDFFESVMAFPEIGDN